MTRCSTKKILMSLEYGEVDHATGSRSFDDSGPENDLGGKRRSERLRGFRKKKRDGDGDGNTSIS